MTEKEKYVDVTDKSNQFVLVCGYCANHDNRDCCLEINFIDMVMYYMCSKCKKINKLDFSLLKSKPYPKSILVK